MTATNETVPTTAQGLSNKHQTMRPIDLVHLAKYTLGDSDLEAEILEMFAHQSQVYFGQLEKASTTKEWYAAAHTLKGSAKSVGACHIADLAEEAEKIEDMALVDAKTAILKKLRSSLDQVVEYIQSLLGEKTT